MISFVVMSSHQIEVSLGIKTAVVRFMRWVETKDVKSAIPNSSAMAFSMIL